jgi:hypothetical protein
MKTQTKNTRERSSLLHKPGIFQTSDLFRQPQRFRVVPKTPIGHQIADRKENKQHVRLYDFTYNHARDVNKVADSKLSHHLGKIYDVKRLRNPKLTVETGKHKTARNASHRPTHQSVPHHKPKTQMARSPAPHVQITTRRQHDRQEQRLKELQI